MNKNIIKVTVDRPLGSKHPEYDMIYPVNYGYVEGIFAGDGEEQDAYILGIDEPLSEFTGNLIAIVHRRNDNEDKWVVTPAGMNFNEDEIRNQLCFQEKYFDSTIEMLNI
ncbi:MAG: inorganic pyrophosphatase [Clostridia bacterium]|nr:inorganic pyrophosphatase [Clostridia bacterium]